MALGEAAALGEGERLGEAELLTLPVGVLEAAPEGEGAREALAVAQELLEGEAQAVGEALAPEPEALARRLGEAQALGLREGEALREGEGETLGEALGASTLGVGGGEALGVSVPPEALAPLASEALA